MGPHHAKGHPCQMCRDPCVPSQGMAALSQGSLGPFPGDGRGVPALSEVSLCLLPGRMAALSERA